ncbi:MAG: Uma2 family endonuclease [bacterium]
MRATILKKDTSRLKLSYRDYVLFPYSGSKQHEIIDGEHYMTPSPSTKHQRISRNLEWIIEFFIKKNKCGEIFDAPCDVLLSDTNVIVPDLVYISKENEDIITKDNIKGIPDLIIEILSPSNRVHDTVLKKDLYEHFSVKEYWIVDPDRETVEVYMLSSSKRYIDPKIYNNNQTLKTKIIPGLEINLKEVFS